MNDVAGKWVTVYRAWGDAEAQIVLGLLKSSGIDCFAEGSAAQSVHPFTIDGLGEIRIKTARDNAHAAQFLIEENRSGLIGE